jgi:hypothetical protein
MHGVVHPMPAIVLSDSNLGPKINFIFLLENKNIFYKLHLALCHIYHLLKREKFEMLVL